MKIILPLGKSPIMCYPNYADIFSIIDYKSNNYLDWIYNYFIQLSVPSNHKLGHRVDFSVPKIPETLPWLNSERINRDFTEGYIKSNIVDFAINAIKGGYYLFTLLDTYFNHNYSTYQKEHLLHEHLIYGFDDTNQIFYFGDNLKSGKYEYSIISFKEFELANDSIKKNSLVDWYLGIYLLKYREIYDYGMYTFRDEYIHCFNYNAMYKLINDYLLERPSEKVWVLPAGLVGENTETYNKCWGIGIYRYLFEYLDLISEGMGIEYRAFYILYEHKQIIGKLMLRLHDMHEKSCNHKIMKICDESIVISDNINGLILKYSIIHQNSLLIKIKQKLDILRTNDILIFTYLKEFLENEHSEL